jgi:hypothetical protein
VEVVVLSEQAIANAKDNEHKPTSDWVNLVVFNQVLSVGETDPARLADRGDSLPDRDLARVRAHARNC